MQQWIQSLLHRSVSSIDVETAQARGKPFLRLFDVADKFAHSF
jgi:hypothetical protein